MSSRRRNVRARQTVTALIAAFILGSLTVNLIPGEQPSGSVRADDLHESHNKLLPVSIAEIKSGGDWAQWGGNSYRNNTPSTHLPHARDALRAWYASRTVCACAVPGGGGGGSLSSCIG